MTKILQYYPIDEGYYINDNVNDFAYFSPQLNEVYTCDYSENTYNIEPCTIIDFKCNAGKFQTEKQVLIICPTRLKNDIRIFHIAICFSDFLQKTDCQFPVFASFAFFNEIKRFQTNFPNLLTIKNEDIDSFTKSLKCRQCNANLNLNQFKACSGCKSNKYQLPLIIFAGLSGKIEKQQDFDTLCIFFIKTLLIQFESEIKNISNINYNQYNQINELFPQTTHPLYNIIEYLLNQTLNLKEAKKHVQESNRLYNGLFDLLQLLPFGGSCQYILPALLFVYPKGFILNFFKRYFPHGIQIELDENVRKDVETLIDKIKNSDFKPYFEDSYSSSYEAIEKVSKVLTPWVKFINKEFKGKYKLVIQQYFTGFPKYSQNFSVICSKLEAFSLSLKDITKNPANYDKQDIVNYGKALQPFTTSLPEKPFLPKTTINELSKIFFQKNIAEMDKITVAASITIFSKNYSNKKYPDPMFLTSEIRHLSYFQTSFEQFNKVFKEESTSKTKNTNTSSSANQYSQQSTVTPNWNMGQPNLITDQQTINQTTSSTLNEVSAFQSNSNVTKQIDKNHKSDETSNQIPSQQSNFTNINNVPESPPPIAPQMPLPNQSQHENANQKEKKQSVFKRFGNWLTGHS